MITNAKIKKTDRPYSIGRMHPLIVDDSRIVIYKHGKLYSYGLKTDERSLICRMKMPAYKKLFSYIRIFERTLRLEPRCAAIVSDNSFILSYSGSIYCIDEKTNECKAEHTFREGMSNVLQFVSIRGIRGFEDSIVYGEYWQNKNREQVRIFERKDGSWRVVYSFPENTIKHIHGIVPDRRRDCVYILTGDEDKESGIWVARNGFQEVEPLLTGKQEYRACVGLADEKGLFFATDNPFETNYIRYAGLSENGRVTEISDVMEINGTCIYGTEWNGKLVLSTAVEQDYSIKRNRIASILSRKLGGGTKSAESVVYIGNIRDGFSELDRYKKDFWPMGLCALGTVLFPQEMNDDLLCLYPVAVKKYDGHSMILKG